MRRPTQIWFSASRSEPDTATVVEGQRWTQPAVTIEDQTVIGLSCTTEFGEAPGLSGKSLFKYEIVYGSSPADFCRDVPPGGKVRSVESRSSSTSLSLLERAKSNDEQAWERIVELYGPLVYRMCRLSQIGADDARDVAQDVFRAAFRNIGRFRRDRPGDSFRGWLMTICKNKIRDYFRQRDKRPAAVGGTDMQMQIHQLPDLEWDSSSDGSRFDSDSNLMQRAIRLVQGDFAENTWQAFWKTTVEGHDVMAVAALLGVSKWTVYQAKSRVLRRIREDIAGLMD